MTEPEIIQEHGFTILKFEFEDYNSAYAVPARLVLDSDSITLEFFGGAELRINQVGGPCFEVSFWKDFDQVTPEEEFEFDLSEGDKHG